MSQKQRKENLESGNCIFGHAAGEVLLSL